MTRSVPRSPEELAACLREAAASGKRIRLDGNNSKSRLGGPVPEADVHVSTSGLDQVLIFEPRDLTISVGAGVPWKRFTQLLDENGMMVPMDPPFAAEATVGGVVAANSNGPRRRLYGTPRDVVIGMRFATLEGNLVQSGGMVVKNVAGLDMGKLLIGSLGTLAAIAVVNFKLTPKPHGARTFVSEFSSVNEAMALRDRILRGPLQPAAVDLLNPAASQAIGRKQWTLAVAVAGNPEVLRRYREELPGDMLEGEAEDAFWNPVREIAPQFLAAHPEGAVARVSVTLDTVGATMSTLPGKAVARAANGVCYAHVEDAAQAAALLKSNRAILEYGPASRTASLPMWPVKDSGYPIMKKIKRMFDPDHLLNRGRYYGDI
jgi:glycolate oxidase FAD binding subunit